MNAAFRLMESGGVIMFALFALSCLLYYRCIVLILSLRFVRKSFHEDPAANTRPSAQPMPLKTLELQIEDSYAQSMRPIAAMIAAAPLLGLLGTVGGMIETFDSLSAQQGGKSFEGLASGISLALTTTETGLAIAIPAMVLTHFAKRELQQSLLLVAQSEAHL